MSHAPATAASTVSPSRTTVAAWFLVTTPMPFIVYIIDGAFMFSDGLSSWRDITQERMPALLAPWIVGQVLFLLCYLWGLAPTAVVATRTRPRARSGWVLATLVATGIAVAGNVAYVVLMIAATGFTGETMGGSALAGAATGPVVQFWADPFSYASVALLAGALRSAGMRPRTGLIVGVIAALLTVAAFATGFVPPFLLAILWFVLGLGLLREGKR